MKTIKIILAIISLIIISSTFPLCALAADQILYSEDFNSYADGQFPLNWEIVGQPGWIIKDNQFMVDVTGTSIKTNAVLLDSIWQDDWSNAIYEVDLYPKLGANQNLVFRFLDNNNFYSIHSNSSGIHFRKYTSTGEQFIADYLPPIELDHLYHFKIIANNNHYVVIMNNTPIFDYIDNNNPLLLGKFGLRGGTGGYEHTQVLFDNFYIKRIPPDEPILPSLNVIPMSQKNTDWAGDKYDHAEGATWAGDNESIGSWGCALTSAAMVLKYHGHNANPKILNDWLKTQPDGYIGNGLINWLAVSRYTNINKSPSSPALLFRKLSPTNENLISELTAGRPAILDVNEHFVVAKSQTSDSFGINDPLTDMSNELLSKYGNTYKIINSYIPSFTDLSYILLVTNTPNIQFYGIDGNPINGVLYEEGKIKLDEDGLTGDNGQKLYTIMLPEPQNGTYKLELSGTGDYFLKYFAYDTLGNPQLFDANGTFNDVQKYDINYGDVTGLVHTNPPVVEKLIVSDLIKAWDEGYRNGKIKKQIYFMVRFELLWAKYYENKGWEKHLERRLNMISIQIRHMPNKLVNSDFSLEFRNLITKYLKQ